ncbi:MAG: hypothetical protein ACQEQC_03680 [Elusimicrobiota bacterium]
MNEEISDYFKNHRLGQILKSLDLIDNEKLEEVLDKYRRSNLRLGEILTHMGYVDKEVVLSLVGKKLGTPYIRLSEYEDIDHRLLVLIPEEIARKNELIPFQKKNNKLKIAMVEPQNEKVKNSIEVLTGYEVQAHIATKEEIDKAIEKNY